MKTQNRGSTKLKLSKSVMFVLLECLENYQNRMRCTDTKKSAAMFTDMSMIYAPLTKKSKNAMYII